MTLLITAFIVAWIVAWVVGAIAVFRRGDLGTGAKVLWLVLLLIFPLVGLLVFYLWQAANPDHTQPSR
jgi:hypothetical protein